MGVNGLIIGINGSCYDTTNVAYIPNTKCTATLEKIWNSSGSYYNRTWTYSGATSVKFSDISTFEDLTHNIMVGTIQGISEFNCYNCRIYYFKLWQGGELVFDGVPCISAKGKIGLYDYISKQTYINPNTSNPFIGG